ncbi:unnamed protein product [Ectocarpus sp. 12 AP-2014]
MFLNQGRHSSLVGNDTENGVSRSITPYTYVPVLSTLLRRWCFSKGQVPTGYTYMKSHVGLRRWYSFPCRDSDSISLTPDNTAAQMYERPRMTSKAARRK